MQGELIVTAISLAVTALLGMFFASIFVGMEVVEQISGVALSLLQRADVTLPYPDTICVEEILKGSTINLFETINNHKI